ncbi:4-amino-4-deoxy-L-arabinose transferase-like glycosyltransferase [Streptomyces sp. 846.5]|nr:glycosyltransferase family 39 protein [Streptomyces sp. 846.5]TDU02909.1 4-amino-4-deoxy-L-arabinose transferase-like glycosyltransferase [Streptomyces sp. 846.5]
MTTTCTITAPAASRPQAGLRYSRPALLVIAALAALLYGWDIGDSRYHAFYADAVRSMSMSWKAFFYGSFDPSSSVTLDKLPGYLWPQALTVRLLGFHTWTLLLPQAVEGVLSVLVLHRAVRRWAGENAALAAAAAFVVTPAVAGLFRTVTEDALFTLLLLLAVDAVQRAAASARLRPLLAAGAWIGLAFQAKMIEAWVALPVFGLVYLVCAPTALRRRLLHTAAAGALALTVSLSWMTAVSLTPASDRPYVDGTTDNSVFSMVVGYNFLSRFSGLGLSAASTGSVAAVSGTSTGTPDSTKTPEPRTGGQYGWTKLFVKPLGSQVGWLYPSALAGVALGLRRRRSRPRTDRQRSGYLLWGGLAGVFGLVFSAGAVDGHTYYMGVVAAPLAALAGAGFTLLWRSYRAGGRAALALPATLAASLAWAFAISREFPRFLPWAWPSALALGLLSAGLLLWDQCRPTRRLAVLGLVAALAANLFTPAAWSATVLSHRYGHSWLGTVGQPALKSGKPGSTSGSGVSGTLTKRQRQLYAYLTAHRDGAEYLMAVWSWEQATPYILAKDAPVLAVGGYTGLAPTPTTTELARLVDAGKLRFVLLKHSARETAPRAAVSTWVHTNCTLVPAADYGGKPTGSSTDLYSCANKI